MTVVCVHAKRVRDIRLRRLSIYWRKGLCFAKWKIEPHWLITYVNWPPRRHQRRLQRSFQRPYDQHLKFEALLMLLSTSIWFWFEKVVEFRNSKYHLTLGKQCYHWATSIHGSFLSCRLTYKWLTAEWTGGRRVKVTQSIYCEVGVRKNPLIVRCRELVPIPIEK